MTGQLSAEDRALIEQTRKVNKTLSMFVFALQEHSKLTSESQVGIADMLVALAGTIRERASRQAADNNGSAGSSAVMNDNTAARLQIEARRIDAEQPDVLLPGRCS